MTDRYEGHWNWWMRNNAMKHSFIQNLNLACQSIFHYAIHCICRSINVYCNTFILLTFWYSQSFANTTFNLLADPRWTFHCCDIVSCSFMTFWLWLVVSFPSIRQDICRACLNPGDLSSRQHLSISLTVYGCSKRCIKSHLQLILSSSMIHQKVSALYLLCCIVKLKIVTWSRIEAKSCQYPILCKSKK